MQKLISMSCPNCGGRLQVGLDVQQFNCVHCGAEWRVARGEGTISLQPIAEQLASIKSDTSSIAQSSERIAAELAIPRLEREIGELQVTNRDIHHRKSELLARLNTPDPQSPVKRSSIRQAWIYAGLTGSIAILTILVGKPETMAFGGFTPIVCSIVPILILLYIFGLKMQEKDYQQQIAYLRVLQSELRAQIEELQFQSKYTENQILSKHADMEFYKRLLNSWGK